jgi:RNA polymerase sigma factor (sigma-70 family)
MHTVLRRLQQAVRPAPDDCPDARLLAGFLTRHDEAAFAALVRRHGPLVRGVCRRLLADPHDADDAFQATFLVLVRRARALARPELLGPWLYGVALRTARTLRTRRDRRQARLRPLPDLPAPDAPADAGELRDRLDAAVRGLPEKYRLPVVLCLLQGMSRREAAGRLGCPEGTLSARLARARHLLRRKLGGLAAGSLAAALAQAGSAAVPAELAAATVRAAVVFANDPLASGAIPASVAALTQGVLAMDRTKRLAAVALGLALLLSAGTGLGLFRGQPPAGGTAQAGCGPTLPAGPADKPAADAAALVVVVRDGSPPRLTVREGEDEISVNTAAALGRYLKRVRKDLPRMDTLTVQAGASARFQTVEPVVAACRDAGFTQIKFEAQPALDPKPPPHNGPVPNAVDFAYPIVPPAVEPGASAPNLPPPGGSDSRVGGPVAEPPAPTTFPVNPTTPPLPAPEVTPSVSPGALPAAAPPQPAPAYSTPSVTGPDRTSDPPLRSPPPNRLDQLQGQWKGVIERPDEEDDIEVEAFVSGDRLFLTTPQTKEGSAEVYRLLPLDPGAKGVGLTTRRGGKEVRLQCLSTLQGDTWRLAMPKDENTPRPRDFRNRKNKVQILELNRAPAQPPAAPEPPVNTNTG